MTDDKTPPDPTGRFEPAKLERAGDFDCSLRRLQGGWDAYFRWIGYSRR